jgi:hypothetical protein
VFVVQRLVTQWYSQYLGATPDAAAGTWVALLASQPEELVLADILASPAYLKRAGGTPTGFAVQMFADFLGRKPAPSEVQNMVDLVNRNGYVGAALSLLTGPEYQGLSVTRRYETQLGREPSAQELAAWVNAHLTQNQITIAFESTDEFYNLGR